jgi:hypothetical protein
MSTKRERILSAIATALVGTTGVGTRIYRSRVEPQSRNESGAIVIEPFKDTPTQNTSLPTLDWSLRVRIVVIVRAAIADQAADPIFSSMHTKLMADLTLGGLAMDIRPGPVDFQFVEADTPAGVFACEYIVKYRTSVSSLDS